MNLRTNILFFLGISLSLITWISTAKPGDFSPGDFDPSDTTKKAKTKTKTPDYTPDDRQGDPYSNPGTKSPFILPLPKNVETDVILDDSLDTYTIEEKVGELDYRPSSTMTFEEYSRHKNQQMMKSYWKDKTAGDSSVSNTDEKSLVPKLKVKGLKGIFGGDYMEMRPTGVVSLDFGARWQRVYNPNIPIRQQRQGQFDFDQTISMNVVGKIGEKLKLTTNWDTKAAFEFQNNLKLEFTGFEEDIIQKIEAGNVSLPVNSSLYSGAQNLFGIKTKLQFGRLTATTVFSTQRGKVEEIKIQGGTMSRDFEIKADNYDEYRHFFMSHFFRDNYERSLKNLPVITSGVIVNRVQVWVTNRVSNTKDLKNFVAYTDLGEPDTTDMYNKSHIKAGILQAKADSNIFAAHNTHNELFDQISNVRDAGTISSTLQGAPYNLVRGSDFEIINQGRKLLPTEFTFHPTLGYISLNSPLRPDEVLAVSFEYSYNGKTYQVGELTEDNQSVDVDEMIILKLLKPATIKTRLPTWDLMMKNVYQLGGTQVTNENFQLRVIYKNDLTGADLPNLQEGARTAQVPLLRLTGLDRLNPNNDIFPDGNFDFVDGVTIDTRNGRIIFPVLEPFGATIQGYFDPTAEADLVRKYVFFELYDSTKSDAQQIASKNKYFLKGRYQAGSSSEIILPGINIAPGSVTVLAGSNPLQEGVDYEIDYNLGRLRIKNQGVLASNGELTIRFEKQDFINFRRKSFIGTRLDYKINKDFYVGSTVLHQTESPNISRVNIGDEPSKNTIVGLDANFKAESRFLTRALDKLPLLSTKAVSTITFSGEGAALIPGYPRILDKSANEGGISYLDDFEGAETPYDLTRIPTKWRLGATPKRFGESDSTTLAYAYHRAKLAWYSVDMGFYNGGQKQFDDFKNTEEGSEYMKNYFVNVVTPQDIFPNKDPQQIVVPEAILDLFYDPKDRGPYNFNPNINSTFISNPTRNWASVTREIRNDIDFDNANIQYIEFWMMDPFMGNATYGKLPLTLDKSGWQQVTTGGYMYFNLGSISEDLMKDSKHAFENGLPVTPGDQGNFTNTIWGKVTNKSFLTNAFDNTDGSRQLQDVGLDGFNNTEEQGNPLIDSIFRALADPAGDDFEYYIGDNQAGKGVLERYRNFNGLENNSPLNSGNDFTPSNSTLPDNEDLNGDNTLNEVDEYYEYKLSINPGDLQVGKNHIVGEQIVKGNDTIRWVQVRIPIREPDSVVGNINGFKSIRFIRMYMTGFQNPMVVRMAQFQLVANQWRAYQPDDINPPDGSVSIEPSGAVLTVSTVNIEENGAASPNKSPYVLPPGFQRDQDAVSQTYRRLNEQSLQLCITDLEDGKAKAAYKNISNNLINYERVKMFLHAESQDLDITDNDMQAFLRIGTDFTENYYEINVPLKLTPPGNQGDYDIWPTENAIDVALAELVDTKGERNRAGANKLFPYSRVLADGKIITVVGNPDLSAVQGMMIGVRNPKTPDKKSYSVCIWANELRVTGFNQDPAYATTGRMNLKLADFATVNLSGKYTTVGWGALDQKVSQRETHNTGEWGVSSNISLDKLIPEKVGLKLPMYVSYDQRIITPKYDPLDPDMLLKNSLNNIAEKEQREQYKTYVIDKTTRRSINFTNVQKIKTKPGAKQHIYDIENFAFTAAYSDTRRTNINLKEYSQKYYKGEAVYNYNIKSKSIEPFKKFESMKSPYLKLIKDFNFSPLPRTISVRGSLDRRITKTQYFEGNPLEGFIQDPFFEKQFTFTRNYGLNWDLTKSLTLDYKANAYAIIDEPNRDPSIDQKQYRDSLWSNVMRLGRLKNFDQSLSANYKLPLDKLPLTDWLNADLKYNGGAMWTSGPLGLRDTLGNVLQNNQSKGVSGKVNLDKLYSKSKFLKNINHPPPPRKQTEKDTSKTLPKKELKGLKTGIRTLMSVKSINFNYDVTRTTAMAGYMAIPKFVGLSPGGNSFDMMPFMFGSQDPYIRDILIQNDWMTRDRRLNSPFIQTKSTTFTAQTQVEPLKDLRIQLNVSKKKTTNYQELFRIDSTGTRFVSESPSRNGSLSLSVISIQTAFRGKIKGSGDPNSSKTFQEFEEYRDILRNRLPNSSLYDTNSQHVLIPAFLAAYTKRDPNKVSLNPYPKIPLPNWRIDYSGLTKIKAIRDIFPSFTIQHGYQSTYNIGNYNSSMLYGSDTINPYYDIGNSPLPGIINSNGLLTPIYIIESVNITEAFNPLIGVNFRTKKRLTGNFQLKKARTITLNLTNAQVTEIMSTDITVGVGIIKTGFQPFKKMAPLKNELNAKMDVTFSDRKTIQRKFEESATVTAGNLNIQIRPNITYAVNQRVNVNIYFERLINAPKISSSYKSASTRFGVLIRFTLS